jgi:hypothetical protein
VYGLVDCVNDGDDDGNGVGFEDGNVDGLYVGLTVGRAVGYIPNDKPVIIPTLALLDAAITKLPFESTTTPLV